MKDSEINYHPGRLTRFLRKISWFFTVYSPPQREVTIATRNGILTFNSKDKTTGRNLYIHRQHEFDDMMAIMSLLQEREYLGRQKGKVILDIGGYIGMSSTAFLLEDMFEKAIAFEASPDNFRLLQKNISNNNLEGRLVAHNIALSDCDGTLSIELSEKNYGDHRVRSEDNTQPDAFGESQRTVIQVQATRFDNLDDQLLGVDKNDIELIWMDIQGHEARFIKGAERFIRNHPHVPLVMEFWPYAIKRSGVSKQDFLNLIGSLFTGYFADIDGKYKPMSMDSLPEFFDEQEDPTKGSTIVLYNEAVNNPR